ncbi:hypothetical protein ES703_56193 [subsurface metagenome]
MWSGTLANIPANWNLCDGGGTTPNLVAKFIRGAPAATEAGTTGGADSHPHASMTAAGGHTHTAVAVVNHNHQVNNSGVHNHLGSQSPITSTALPDVMQTGISSIGQHNHTTNGAGGHSHTMDTPANHSHTINTGDGRPPYYEVAYIQAAVGATVAANIIIIWTGLLANIPAGWTLCDGGGARPDLRTRFVRGVNTAITNPGGLGGNTTHLHIEDAVAAHSHTMDLNGAAHAHSYNAYTWSHQHNARTAAGGATVFLMQSDSGGGNHTHANTDNIDNHSHNPMGNDGGHTHVVNTASSLPAYYDVAYVINDGGAVIIPTSGIMIWVGLLANIPATYTQCEGAGGRPELRSKFIRGSAAAVEPGGGGGSDTHTHTDINAGAHNGHSVPNDTHTHANTDTIGSHTHATGTINLTPAAGNQGLTVQAADGAHSHTFDAYLHNHTLTDPGNHNHNNWSTDDGRPAYYEVIFISKDA